LQPTLLSVADSALARPVLHSRTRAYFTYFVLAACAIFHRRPPGSGLLVPDQEEDPVFLSEIGVWEKGGEWLF
jgi:hypothetical protein